MPESTISYDSLSDRDHTRVSQFMDRHAGIQLPKNKKNLIETRLRKRQRALNFKTLSEYIKFALESSEDEQIHLIDSLTTNKTEFFREASHYDHYIYYLQSVPSNTQVKIWSAGCSSGEEPYTLALLASEHRPQSTAIFATDISVSMLQRARRAIYPHSSISSIPLTMRRRYLLRRKTEAADEIKISAPVRQLVNFDTFNLITSSYKSLPVFDIIFCRNVMIYFNAQQRESIIRQFCNRLKPQGLLFIGHSETLNNEKPHLRAVAPTVYQREST
ncbi:CheR family methyltransferase [Alteromonas gracilis]|uniref:CheR family methyltransferase n=1 Tax=Alteromonas gracilis TaxID=1479524 RepID=UPI003736E411